MRCGPELNNNNNNKKKRNFPSHRKRKMRLFLNKSKIRLLLLDEPELLVYSKLTFKIDIKKIKLN